MTDEITDCIYKGRDISDCKSAFVAWEGHRLATSKRNYSRRNRDRGIATKGERACR